MHGRGAIGSSRRGAAGGGQQQASLWINPCRAGRNGGMGGRFGSGQVDFGIPCAPEA